MAAGAALRDVPTDWPLHLLPPGQVLLTKTHAHSSRRLPQRTFMHLCVLTYFYLPSRGRTHMFLQECSRLCLKLVSFRTGYKNSTKSLALPRKKVRSREEGVFWDQVTNHKAGPSLGQVTGCPRKDQAQEGLCFCLGFPFLNPKLGHFPGLMNKNARNHKTK